MENITELLQEKKFAQIKSFFVETNIVDIASIIEEVSYKENMILLFKLIPKDIAAEVFVYLSSEKKQELVESFSDSEISKIIEDLYLDDTVELIEEMPANVVDRILLNTKKETRENINKLLKYPENSAGSIMTIEYVDLKQDLTVEQAFEKIRKNGMDKETIYTSYVTDGKKVLIGVVSAKELMLADPSKKINDIMTTNIVYVNTTDDQEEISKVFAKYNFNVVPVVDTEKRIVGIITIDDILDVIEEENTEDIHKMAAIAPNTDEYLKTSVFVHAKKRVFWLLFLMLSSIITGLIITSYEKAFVLIPTLVSFIPMIMATGGNSGSQTSTLIIRGMALGEVKVKDFFKVFFKELNIALLIGLVLGIINFFRIWIFEKNAILALVVSATMYITIIIAKLIGFMLPMVAKKLKIDPALMAAPLIATIVDALSMFVYFLIASLAFGI